MAVFRPRSRLGGLVHDPRIPMAFGYSGNTNWGSVCSATAISLTFALVTRIAEIPDLAPGQRTNTLHDDARHRKAHPAPQTRRNRLHRDINSEIGRSPEQVDQPECERDLPSAWVRDLVHDWNELICAVPSQPTVRPAGRG